MTKEENRILIQSNSQSKKSHGKFICVICIFSDVIEPGLDQRDRRKRKREGDWDMDQEFCLFHLYKENKETLDAIQLISKMLQ